MKKLILAASILIILLNACSKDSPATPGSSSKGTGWYGTDDPTKVPSKVKFGTSTSNLPGAVDLTSKFPPIGDQGQYGTCVGWATAYNVKTAINGIDNNYTPTDLANPDHQFSPKDLFYAIDDAKKGADCNGTNFEDALSLVQSRGVASLSTVPYTNLGSCSNSQVQAAWTAEANNNKIKNFRKIDPTAASIKEQLANNIPIILGAKLSDNFVTWNSDEVISSNTTYNQVGIHSYHALSIAGYDDSKGNGAFKVVNSWGTTWGSKGYIWVDYNFMVNEFAYDNNFYIATNQKGDGKKPDINPSGNGYDLASWVFDDVSEFSATYPTARSTNFNAYNIGKSTVNASSGWKIYYIYYNAYNADDYGIIFTDIFTTSIPANSYACNGNTCEVNYPFPSGSNLAELLFGTGTPYIQQTYTMPYINGDYYLLMVVDGDDVIQEDDESNNLYYTSYDPIYFVNGYAPFKSSGFTTRGNGDKAYDFHNQLSPTASNLKKCDNHSAVNKNNRNAYSPEEIIGFIKSEKKQGKLGAHLVNSSTTYMSISKSK